MGKPEDRIDLDVAKTFEQIAEKNGWRPLGTELHQNYGGDQIFRHDSYAADGRIHYEIKVFDAVAISPDGRSITSHAADVLQEIGRYLTSAELEVLKRRAKAGENHG
ncbi:MAG: hypothetical protein V1887_03100 [Candidatus Aenigmatarchaeota archaeon]